MARTSIRDQSDKGNRYAILALKDRRATLAGEIQRFKDGIKHREQQLAHMDATLRILDPEYRADTIAPKRIRRVKLFGGGELNRLIIDALRRANGEALSTPQIADAIIAAKGYGHEAKPALTRRVRANLSYLLWKRRAVEKIGDRMTARWRLRADT
ncbi:hypothetical protein MXD81_44655 [Microbacteriaceae bacterium K1510]|nr:hypothetical protein [Microbacteriaceae bacterium K1510]